MDGGRFRKGITAIDLYASSRGRTINPDLDRCTLARASTTRGPHVQIENLAIAARDPGLGASIIRQAAGYGCWQPGASAVDRILAGCHGALIVSKAGTQIKRTVDKIPIAGV